MDKTWQNMTPDEMVENAKTALKDKKEMTPEEEIENDAENGYFEDD